MDKPISKNSAPVESPSFAPDSRQGLVASRVYANDVVSQVLMAQNEQVRAFAAKKPHLRKMLVKRELNLVWPSPLASPAIGAAHWLAKGIEVVSLRISFADMVVGHVVIESQHWRLAVDSGSLHLLCSAKKLPLHKSFACIAHCQTWLEGYKIAVIALTAGSKRKIEEEFIQPFNKPLGQ